MTLNKKSKRHHLACDKCDYNKDYYMLTNDVWIQANGKHDGMLCLKCVEDNLGRKLVLKDFTFVPINYGVFGFYCEEYLKG